MQRHLGRQEITRPDERIRNARIDDETVAAQHVRMPETREFGIDVPVEAVDVLLAGVEIDLRQAVVGTDDRRDRVLQHLEIGGPHCHGPEARRIGECKVAPQQTLRAGSDGA